jgi:hypothetical protein
LQLADFETQVSTWEFEPQRSSPSFAEEPRSPLSADEIGTAAGVIARRPP